MGGERWAGTRLSSAGSPRAKFYNISCKRTHTTLTEHTKQHTAKIHTLTQQHETISQVYFISHPAVDLGRRGCVGWWWWWWWDDDDASTILLLYYYYYYYSEYQYSSVLLLPTTTLLYYIILYSW